jgi:hypothetical protein
MEEAEKKALRATSKKAPIKSKGQPTVLLVSES